MIELYVNGELLQLYPDTSIPVEEENPLYIRKYISTTHTLPFNVPRIGNDQVLGYLSQRDNRARYKQAPATISYGGHVMFKGAIRVMASDQKSYKILFTTKPPDYVDVNLRDLDMGGNRADSSGYNKVLPPYTVPYTYPDKDYFLAPYENEKIKERYVSGYTKHLQTTSFYYRYDYVAGQAHSQEEWFKPCPYVFYVLDRALSVPRTGTFFADAEMRTLCLVSAVWIMVYTDLRISSFKISSDNFNLEGHVPDKTLTELLNVLAEYFCMIVFFNKEGQLQMDMLKDMPDNDIVDVTEQVDGEGRHEYNETNGYRITHTRPTEDAIYEKDPAPEGAYIGEYDTVGDLPSGLPNTYAVVKQDGHYYKYDGSWKISSYAYLDEIGDDAEEIKVDACTVTMEDSKWPISDEAVNRQINVNDRYSFGFRFAFARGTVTDTPSGAVNLLSSDNWTADGTKVGDYSLRITGESGTRKVFWERFMRYRNDVVHIVDVKLSLPAANLAYHQLVRIGNQVYTWRKKKYNLTMQGISTVNLELYKR
jgi:hypothetical protein